MTGYQITAEERARLTGLQWHWIVLYHAIRARMDFKTGRVGIRPEISWLALQQDCYVEPGPGIPNSGTPNKDVMRRAAAGLVRVGLVEMQSNEAQRKLIFFLPLARRNSFVQKQPATNPPDQPARQAQREKHPEPARPRQAEPATHREDSSSNHHHHISEAPSVVKTLQWSDSLGESERKMLTKMLTSSRVNGQAQELADELTAAIEKGAIRKGVVPWFSGILNRFQAGTYEQTPEGAAIARRRAQAQRTDPPPPPEAPRASSATARAHLESMREKLRSGKR